jgi:hypothetical protein
MQNLTAEEMDGIVGGQDLCDTLEVVTFFSCMTGLFWACGIGSVGHIIAC